MTREEYIKTITYNGHEVKVGLDDAGQQFVLEYLDDNGELVEFCCGAYTPLEYGLEHLFGPEETK